MSADNDHYMALANKLDNLAWLLGSSADTVRDYPHVVKERDEALAENCRLIAKSIEFSDDMATAMLALSLKDAMPELGQEIAAKLKKKAEASS